jgi:hypothetical protein
MTFKDASQEWVNEQAYGHQYGFVVGSISPRGARPMNLTPYKVTTYTVGSATNPFTITPTGDAGNMREYYLSLTLNVAASVMWASSIDVFKGGDASALAPVIGVNVYHILEYISGHFMVEKMV